MNQPNLSANVEPRRNDNAEWAILKELAHNSQYSSSPSLSLNAEFARPREEREKYRERGAKLMRVINRMLARPSAEQKAAQLNQIHRIAKNIGIEKDLDDVLSYGMSPYTGSEIGKQTLADRPELTAEEEQQAEALRERVVDMTKVAPGALAARFPSHTFLYHGTTTQRMEKILQTGGLKNGVALQEDNPNIESSDLNSGYEGISWSMNAIDALPGTRGHIVGFVAAPEDILDSRERLIVPSRPAPYEVLQVDSAMDQREVYRLKNQAETWGDGSPNFGGEENTVDNNLMRMLTYEKGSLFNGESLVYDYKGSLAPEDLRQYYTVDTNGNITWDENIYQESKVPPALPWMQSIIDRGFLTKPEYADLDSVEKILARAKQDPNFIRDMVFTAREEAEPINQAYAQAVKETKRAIRIRPEEMYFVTSHRDLDSWLKVMARTGVVPKGILLYDDTQVVMENFASEYEGNHQELGAEIGRTVAADQDFWRSKMGLEPSTAPRSGTQGQVILESAVSHDKELRLKDGQLVVENS